MTPYIPFLTFVGAQMTPYYADDGLELYALEQAERLKSHDRAKKVVHTFAWNPQYIQKWNYAKG